MGMVRGRDEWRHYILWCEEKRIGISRHRRKPQKSLDFSELIIHSICLYR